MTKAEMQKSIEEKDRRIAELEKQLDALTRSSSQAQEIAEIIKYKDYYADNMAEKDRTIARLRTQLGKFSPEDLPKAEKSDIERENIRLRDALAEEKGRTESYKRTIKFLEQLLDGKEDASVAESPKIPVVGRPSKGSVETDRYARKLRREGYSVREIAERTGYSVGKTAAVTESVKITPEIKERQKQHRAENRKKAKESV